MQTINKILQSGQVIKTAVVLAVILLLLLTAHIFNNRYNAGYSKRNLFLSRVSIVAAIGLFLIWLFGWI